LSFDVSLIVPNPDYVGEGGVEGGQQICVRFQNNIQSIFSRVRLLYGANPLEDIINYNVIVRNLTEWTAGNPSMTIDQGTIADGIGNNTLGFTVGQSGTYGVLNTRANYIQGVGKGLDTTSAFDASAGKGLAGFIGASPAGVLSPSPSIVWTSGATPPVVGSVPTTVVTRRYQIQFALGIMTQEKLIPTKYMASQLAVEISMFLYLLTLALDTPTNCLVATYQQYVPAVVSPATPAIAGYDTASLISALNYCVHNVNLIPEILEFDASYDTAFLQGLQNGGVPLKFSSWHTFLFSSANAASVNLLIQERSRSVKSIFTVQRLGQPDIRVDNGATFFDTSVTTEGGTMQNYQYRVGGRYA